MGGRVGRVVAWVAGLFGPPSHPPLLVRFRHLRRRLEDLERIALTARFSPSNVETEQHIFLAQGVGVMPPFGRARETRLVARFKDGAHVEFRVRPADAVAGVVHEVTLIT
jgi:hypothetical protein